MSAFIFLYMRMLTILSLLLCLVFQSEAQKTPLPSGIVGQVTWKSGNQMPSPDRPVKAAKGIRREVWIYELTPQSQTEQLDGFYQRIRTKRVAKVVTSRQGKFKVKLAPGRYSIFTKEQRGLWANISDDDGNVYPITVEAGTFTPVQFEINYAAAF